MLESKLLSPFSFNETIAAAVSSQVVSIPKTLIFLFRILFIVYGNYRCMFY